MKKTIRSSFFYLCGLKIIFSMIFISHSAFLYAFLSVSGFQFCPIHANTVSIYSMSRWCANTISIYFWGFITCFTVWYGLPSTIQGSFSFRIFPDIFFFMFVLPNKLYTYFSISRKKIPNFLEAYIYKDFLFLPVSKIGMIHLIIY